MSFFINFRAQEPLGSMIKILAKEQMINPASVLRQALKSHFQKPKVRIMLLDCLKKSSNMAILEKNGVSKDRIHHEINTYID